MRKSLDTNICSYILRAHPQVMIERFANLSSDQVWLSAIVAAELRFGAAKLSVPKFSATVESWLARFQILPWSVESTHCYATIRAELERNGKVIGGMDLLIAAHVLAEDSVLITNNAKEFLRVPNLAVEEWE